MNHAAKIITEELAYLRILHGEAAAQNASIIGNSIGSDIADCEQALQLIESMEAVRAEAKAA